MESLPPELHYEITRCLTELRFPALKLSGGSGPLFHFSPDLESLSRVSRHWRSIALQFLLENLEVDGASNEILNDFIVTYQPHLWACKNIKVNLYPHSKKIFAKLFLEWAGGRLSSCQETASRESITYGTNGLHGLQVDHTPGGVFITTSEADAEHRQFWASVSHGHYGPWTQRRMDLLAELLRKTPGLESLSVGCLPRRMPGDLELQNILAALKGRRVTSIHLEDVLPSTVHRFIPECRLRQLHLTSSMEPPDERLFPAMVTNMACTHIRISSASFFCMVQFPIPLNQPLAPIRGLSLTMPTSLEHLFQLFGGISSTLEELFLSGRIDLVPPPKSVHLQRLRTIHLEVDNEPLLLSHFRECSSVEDIIIGEVYLGAPDIGELRSALVAGFVGLRCLTLRAGSVYYLFERDDDGVEIRCDTAPLEEEMKWRNAEFRLEV